MQYKDKNWLYNQYVENKLSFRQIGELCNVSTSSIKYWMLKFNIPRRTKSELMLGALNPMYGKTHSDEVKKIIANHSVEMWTDSAYRIKQSERMAGENNPMFGKNHSEETKAKMGAIVSERFKLEENRQKISEGKKKSYKENPETKQKLSEHGKKLIGDKNPFYGKQHSEETRKIISEKNFGKRRGELSSNWQGGRTELSHSIRNCRKYIDWRTSVFKRDDYTCFHCGQRGGKLNVDHIIPFSKILTNNNISSYDEALNCEQLWNLDNGRTLCKLCHLKTDTYAGNLKTPKMIAYYESKRKKI